MLPHALRRLLRGSRMTMGTCGSTSRGPTSTPGFSFLPNQGTDPFNFRDLILVLLPQIAFFAMWNAPMFGEPAKISEYLPAQLEADQSIRW